MANLFTELLEEASQKNIIPARTLSAREWFREKAEDIVVKDPKSTIIRTSASLQTRTLNGFMYTYLYRPKYQDTLPFHDRFPLVFPFKRTKLGFYGINLHYLPLPYRAILMDNLYKLSMDKNYDDETRLRLSSTILEGSARFRYYKPCVRQYLNNHVQTKFALIPSNQWDIALFLPFERFINESGGRVSTQKVHRDSIKKIRRGI